MKKAFSGLRIRQDACLCGAPFVSVGMDLTSATYFCRVSHWTKIEYGQRAVQYEALRQAHRENASLSAELEAPKGQQKEIGLLIKACQVATDCLDGGADLGDNSQCEDLSDALTAVKGIIQKRVNRRCVKGKK